MRVALLMAVLATLLGARSLYASQIGSSNAVINGNFETVYEDNGSGTPTSTTVVLNTSTYTHGINEGVVASGSTTPSSPNGIDLGNWTGPPGSSSTTAGAIGIQNYPSVIEDSTTSFYVNAGGSVNNLDGFQDLGAVSSELTTNATYLLSVDVYSRSALALPTPGVGLIASTPSQTYTGIQPGQSNVLVLTPTSTSNNAVGANPAAASDVEGESVYNYYFNFSTLPGAGSETELYVYFGYSAGSGQLNLDNLSLTQVVPEPGSMLLAGLGMFGLVLRRNRRRLV